MLASVMVDRAISICSTHYGVEVLRWSTHDTLQHGYMGEIENIVILWTIVES